MKLLKLFKNKAVLAIAARGVGFLASFVLSYAIAKNFDLSDAGSFLWAMAIVTALTTVSSLGTGQHLVRVTASEKEIGQESFDMFSLSFFGVVITFIVFFNFCFFWGGDNREVLLYLAPSLFLLGVASSFSYIIQGLGYVKSSLLFLTTFTPAFLSLYIFYNDNVLDVALARSAISLLLLVIIFFVFYFILKVRIRLDFRNLLSTFSRARSLFFVAIALMIISWGGQVLSGFYLSSEDLARLSITQKISMALGAVLIGVDAYVSPKFAKEYKASGVSEQLRYLYTKTIFASTIPAVLMFLLLIFFSEDLLRYIGSGYVGYSSLLLIFLIGQLVNACTGSAQNLLNMSGNDDLSKNSVFVATVVFLILIYPMLYFFGVYGVAVVISSSVIIQNLLSAFYCWRFINAKN